jgi:hypothetical protein
MKISSEKVIEVLRKTKKIGIVIHSGSYLFSNGIIQNAYFNYKCFENLGLQPELLCHDKDPVPFGFRDLKLKQIVYGDKSKFDPSEYFLVMTVTRSMDKLSYDMFKQAGVSICSFICGNCIMHDQEDFCRGNRGQSTFIDSNSKTDELWIIPSYWNSHCYLETVRMAPSKMVPHLWSPEIIKEFVPRIYKQSEENLFYNPSKHNSKKINILILEPNLALFKNAWIPIIACEKLHQMYPELIDQVYVFNFPKENNAWEMADSLTIHKDKKLRRFNRLPIPEIMLHFNSLESTPIFLSYQVNNSLNYLYYELLYYNYPLVHNSPDLDKCGFYYPTFIIEKCVDQIIEANLTYNENIEKHKIKHKKYLKKSDPLDPDLGEKWNKLINDLVSKDVSKFLKEREEKEKESVSKK